MTLVERLAALSMEDRAACQRSVVGILETATQAFVEGRIGEPELLAVSSGVDTVLREFPLDAHSGKAYAAVSDDVRAAIAARVAELAP